MEQACDVAPIFRRLKELIKQLVYQNRTQQQCWRTRHIHEKINDLPVNLPGWKKNLIVNVVRCFPELIREACTLSNVRQGFIGNGQICSASEPVPDFLNCLATRRVPYFDVGTTVEDKRLHCEQLMNWFGPDSLACGFIEESKFCEHGIKLDYNEQGVDVEKTATLTNEGQQRAKHLSNIETRHARQMIGYNRSFQQYQKLCKKKNDETNVLTRGADAERKILTCIGLFLNISTPTLDLMTVATLGERGGKRNGITFPKSADLVDFLRSRYPRTITETTGTIHYYSKPSGTNRESLCTQCCEYRNTLPLEPVVTLPLEPLRPVRPHQPQQRTDDTEMHDGREQDIIPDVIVDMDI